MNYDSISDKDLSKTRTIELENGNVLYVKNTDPYGFWTVHYEHGQLPKSMRGAYTTWDYALAAVKKYLADKDEPIVAIHTQAQ
jgi:hypothetical protein